MPIMSRISQLKVDAEFDLSPTAISTSLRELRNRTSQVIDAVRAVNG